MRTQHTSMHAPPEGFQGDMTWQCPVPGCGEETEFHNEEASVIAFLIVHHLVKRHWFTRNQVLGYDKGLRDAANEYVGFPTDRHGKLME